MKFFTTEKLLTFSPESATLIAINERVGTTLHPSYVKVGEVTDPVGLLAKVEIEALLVPPNSQEGRFSNKGWVTIDRLDIAAFFNGQFVIDFGEAISSLDVARLITERTGILFDERDFVEAVLTEQSNKLVASSRSLRWVGELAIVKP